MREYLKSLWENLSPEEKRRSLYAVKEYSELGHEQQLGVIYREYLAVFKEAVGTLKKLADKYLD